MSRGASPGWVFARLLAVYGPQRWWPARSRFEVMVGAVLVQHAAWSNVERAIQRLRGAGMLDPAAIVAATPAALATLLHPAGAYRVKSRRLAAMCHWMLEHGGGGALARWSTPRLRGALLGVHGIGEETADAILLYAFARPVVVVDAYARRLAGRLEGVDASGRGAALRACVSAHFGDDAARLNEFHALVVAHGKRHCRARPRCGGCALAVRCAFARAPRAVNPREVRG